MQTTHGGCNPRHTHTHSNPRRQRHFFFQRSSETIEVKDCVGCTRCSPSGHVTDTHTDCLLKRSETRKKDKAKKNVGRREKDKRIREINDELYIHKIKIYKYIYCARRSAKRRDTEATLRRGKHGDRCL